MQPMRSSCFGEQALFVDWFVLPTMKEWKFAMFAFIRGYAMRRLTSEGTLPPTNMAADRWSKIRVFGFISAKLPSSCLGLSHGH